MYKPGSKSELGQKMGKKSPALGQAKDSSISTSTLHNSKMANKPAITVPAAAGPRPAIASHGMKMPVKLTEKDKADFL